MDNTQQALVGLVSEQLFGGGELPQVPEDILKEAALQGVRPLISDDYQTIASNMRVSSAHAMLTDLLSGIPFVTIKGCASACYYPEPVRRQMGDVDIYVSPADYPAAEKRLLSCGFEQKGLESGWHGSFYKNGIHFELHHKIKGVPNGSADTEKAVRRCLSDIIETAVTLSTDYGDILIPDEFHHGLVMLLHVAEHIVTDGGIGLRHLCDWAVYADKADISRYQSKLEEMGLWVFACQLTAVSVKFLGLKEMPWLPEISGGFLTLFMDDILNAGNLGKRSAGRSGSMELAGSKNKLRSFIGMAKRRYPFARNNPLLVPTAMVLYLFSYLFTRLSGKKQWVTLDMMKSGKKRTELYGQFRLFKI